jgi:hypothetical protein
MKNKKTKPAGAVKRFSRRPLMIVTAIALVAIAAITVVSRQSVKQTNEVQAVSAATANVPAKHVQVASQDVPVNPQTAQIRPLTQEEAERLAREIKGMLSKSTDGLPQVKHEDGSTSMDLQGRFQNVTLARVNADGTVTHSCVDSPKAAAKFLGVDPRLVEEDGKLIRPTPVN